MRQNSRFLCSDLVTIEWRSVEMGRHRSAGVLDDISSRGACLLLEHPIPARTMVHLVCGTCELRGKVRHCRYRTGLGYFVGVQFARETEWTPAKFKPRHLFDPAAADCSGNPQECPTTPPCTGCHTCPYPSLQGAANSAVDSAGKVRQVAREVARVCRNLDMRLLETCYSNLYGELHGRGLLEEFVDAYHEAHKDEGGRR